MEGQSDHIRSFALRQGRISKGQRRALDELSDRYCISDSDRPLDVRGQFGGKYVIVEIGFGMGAATADIAERFPELGFIGVEVYPAGVGKLLGEIERRSLDNLKILREDAINVINEMLPPVSISGVHIFFPDPWPKKRHHKRRLICKEFLDSLKTKIVSGGYLYMVTDWEEYAEWMLNELSKVDGFANTFGGYAKPLDWRPKTKFEQKGLSKGHVIREIYVTKA